jgi:hypothetical protein
MTTIAAEGELFLVTFIADSRELGRIGELVSVRVH